MNKELHRRILQISYERKFSHIGSCLSAVDIIETIYNVKEPNEKFVLSAGHAHLAHAVVLEKHGIGKAEDLLVAGIHCDRENKCDVSTGSLGQGLAIAVGLALADRSKNVYCLLSDGECAEGMIWESLGIASKQKLDNLKLSANLNGWSAYDKIDVLPLIERFMAFGWRVIIVDGHNKKQIKEALQVTKNIPTIIAAKTRVEHYDFLRGLEAHYKVINEKEYKKAIESEKNE